MAESTLEQRVEWLQRGLREIGKLCLQLGDDVASAGSGAIQQAGPPSAPTADPAIPLAQFMENAQDLTLSERLEVVDAAIAMLSEVYVHLPLKRSLHGIDPVQRLRLLRQRIASQIKGVDSEESPSAFHGEMIEIFHSLRDLHTNYILPASYQGLSAFLPFLVQECYEGQPPTRKYVVVRVQAGLPASPFKPGVTITSWNGIPIERAVELNASREAGSNADARHARGLEALTLRPMALTAPPDEAWVIVGYEADGQQLERRFDWQVIVPAAQPNGATPDDGVLWDSDSAHVMGFDAQTMAVQRAKKSLFFPAAVDEEMRMSEFVAQAVGAAPGPAATTGRSFESAQSSETIAPIREHGRCRARNWPCGCRSDRRRWRESHRRWRNSARCRAGHDKLIATVLHVSHRHQLARQLRIHSHFFVFGSGCERVRRRVHENLETAAAERTDH